MKKLFIVLLSCLFFSCATTNVKSENNFNITYDDITDDTIITHSDMKLGYFYNLKDNAFGERENIRVYLVNNEVAFIADYQYRDWLHINEIVFIGNNSRVTINNGIQSGEVINLKTVFVREKYTACLNEEQINSLMEILNAPVSYAAFVGSKGHTDKMEISPKVKNAMLETFNKYFELK